jgi:triacylglycerol lipase
MLSSIETKHRYIEMNNFPVVTVHGLFGWIKEEMNIDYWGNIFSDASLKIYEAEVGPVSSWHDRACEVIAQVKGLRVDYGLEHSKKYGHKRYGKDYRKKGFHPQWDDKNPIHLIGHSAGGNSIRMVQHLLDIDHYNLGSNADWVKSISCISSVLNGTPVPYMLGCNKKTGIVAKVSVASLLERLVLLCARATKGTMITYDFNLEQWGFKKTGTLREDIKQVSNLSLFNGKDNLAYNLTMQGSYEFNGEIKSYPNTYYFGYATEQTFQLPFFKTHYPKPRMNILIWLTGVFGGKYNFEKNPPFEGWGQGHLQNHKWWSNDGLVPEISQYYPFINEAIHHPIAFTKGISNKNTFTKGIWYYENITEATGISFDHMDIVCGATLDPLCLSIQNKFYSNLWNRLANLK